MKKLPSIYKNPNEHYETHNNTIYYCNTKTEIKKDKFDVNLFLNNLSNDSGYIFNKNVFIETLNNSFNSYILYYDSNHIYLSNGNVINKNDIVSIKRV